LIDVDTLPMKALLDMVLCWFVLKINVFVVQKYVKMKGFNNERN